jgi:hypothetical protein
MTDHTYTDTENGTREVLVPVADSQGECYHDPQGCGGHRLTRIEATAAELLYARNLRACMARGCDTHDIPVATWCYACGHPVFDPEDHNGSMLCHSCYEVVPTA